MKQMTYDESIGELGLLGEKIMTNYFNSQGMMVEHSIDKFDREKDMLVNGKKVEIKTEQPLVLELACGRGEYAVGLGRMFPEQNFIGIDIKGNRIWKGASIANKEGLKNIAFVRTQIDQVANYFGIQSRVILDLQIKCFSMRLQNPCLIN